MSSTTTAERQTERGAELYRAHADMLLRYCRRQLGSAAEAEDAVQTTFVYALRALRRGVEPENEEAWLTTIARNVCHWQRRTAARAPVPSEVAGDAPARGAPGDYDELIGLDEALASMPERQRRALVLREWRGLPLGEIASRLDVSPTATNALLTRARSSLALALSVARQPALVVVGLVGELKAVVKALVGSSTAKAGAVAVTVIATTGVTTGLVVAPVEAERRAPTAEEVAGRTAGAAAVLLNGSSESSRRRAAALGGVGAKPAGLPRRASPGRRAEPAVRPRVATSPADRQSQDVVAERERPAAPVAEMAAASPSRPAVASSGISPEQILPAALSFPAPQLPAPPSAPTVPFPQPTLPELPVPAPPPPAGAVTVEPPVPEPAAAVGGADETAGRAAGGVLP